MHKARKNVPADHRFRFFECTNAASHLEGGKGRQSSVVCTGDICRLGRFKFAADSIEECSEFLCCFGIRVLLWEQTPEVKLFWAVTGLECLNPLRPIGSKTTHGWFAERIFFSNFCGFLLFMYSKQDICILKYVFLSIFVHLCMYTKVKINLFLNYF